MPPVPEPQTIRDCAKLRLECQREVFAHIDKKHEEQRERQDEQHGEQMRKLADISKKLAYQKGQANGRADTGSHVPVAGGDRGNVNWERIAVIITLSCAAIGSTVAAVASVLK